MTGNDRDMDSGSETLTPPDVGWPEEIEHKSLELLEQIDKHRFVLRGTQRELLSELHRTGVSGFVIRCCILPLVAWADISMTNSTEAKTLMKKLSRKLPPDHPGGSSGRHVEYVNLLLMASDALLLMQREAPTLYSDMMRSVDRDACRAKDRDMHGEVLEALRQKFADPIGLSRLTCHLCNMMEAATASAPKSRDRHHGLVAQLLVACGLEEDADYESLRGRIKQRDVRKITPD
jgi:hypothetical protein